MGKTLGWLIIAIILKSLFQTIVGSEHTSIDGLFYIGSFLGSFAYILLEENLDLLKLKFYKFWDLLPSMNTLKLDSDDESESLKGKKVVVKEKGENPSFIKQIPDKEVSGGAVGGSGINPEDSSFWSHLVKSIRDETRDLIYSIKDIGAKKLEKYNGLWSSDDPEMDRVVIAPENAEGFITLLQKQSNMFTAFVRNRMEWVDVLRTQINIGIGLYTAEEVAKIKAARTKLAEIHNSYMSKTQIIPNHNSPIVQVKVFFAALNQYRNESLKELNKVENIILDKIRKHNILSKDGELKRVLNLELIEAKKEFNTQDSYLRAKIGEALKNKK